MRDPDKPQQIIEAAVRVFARKGYFNSRVSDIALAARMTWDLTAGLGDWYAAVRAGSAETPMCPNAPAARDPTL